MSGKTKFWLALVIANGGRLVWLAGLSPVAIVTGVALMGCVACLGESLIKDSNVIIRKRF